MSTTWVPQGGGFSNASMISLSGEGGIQTETSVLLNTNYTYNSAGKGAAWFFISSETANLTDIIFYVKTVNGTGSTDGVLNWEVREGIASNFKPGSTLTASGTWTTDGTTGWKTISGLTASLTAGKYYWVVIADADGDGTNNTTVVLGSSNGSTSPINMVSWCSSTSNGFSTPSSTTAVMFGAVKIGSTWQGGWPFNSMTTVTSGTYERGMRFRLREAMTLVGFIDPQDAIMNVSGNISKIYADATAPGGTTLLSYTAPTFTISGTAPAGTRIIIPVTSRIDLAAETWYRCVLKPSSSVTTPRKVVGPGTFPTDLKTACFPCNGDCYWTNESGGTWVDDTSSLSLFAPLLVPKTASAGSGTHSFAFVG